VWTLSSFALTRVRAHSTFLFLFSVSSHDNEELHILYSSPNIIRQIKSRRMKWAGHMALMGEERKLYMVLVG
jgi:hypothetical protein